MPDATPTPEPDTSAPKARKATSGRAPAPASAKAVADLTRRVVQLENRPEAEVQERPVAPAGPTPWWIGHPLVPEGALPNVHLCLAYAQELVTPVAKGGQNADDGYRFKRIDDFMTAANAAMSQAGVHQVPKVIGREVDNSHTARDGQTVVRWVDLQVRFRFFGPAGDYVDSVTWGEGRDAADKSTNKAMTAAQKYALMYVLMVPTGDIQDADRDSPEAHAGRQPEARADQAAATHPTPREARRQQQAEDDARREAAIARADASAEDVARFRREVLVLADGVPDALARKEQLMELWQMAAVAGALGAMVDVPEAWQRYAPDATVRLHDLLMGAQAPTLPPSGETTPDQPVDPWATQPDGIETQEPPA